ncbi:uncharacterized protein LOC144143221 [Haemaphysalis longicornis]
MVRSPVLLFQAFLLWTSRPWPHGSELAAPGHQFRPWNASQLPPPTLDAAVSCVWQRGYVTAAVVTGGAEYKEHSAAIHLGHDTVSTMVRSPVLLFQAFLLWTSRPWPHGSELAAPGHQFRPWNASQLPPPTLDAAVSCVWQRGYVTAAVVTGGAEYKEHSAAIHLGHDTVSTMVRSPVLLFQAFLLWTSRPWPHGSELAAPGHQFRPWNASQLPPPTLDAAVSCVWQRGYVTAAVVTGGAEYKEHSAAIHLGHDTVSTMVRSPVLLFQVSYRNSAACVKSSNRCLLAVSCPPELFDVKKHVTFFCIICHLFCQICS